MPWCFDPASALIGAGLCLLAILSVLGALTLAARAIGLAWVKAFVGAV